MKKAGLATLPIARSLGQGGDSHRRPALAPPARSPFPTTGCPAERQPHAGPLIRAGQHQLTVTHPLRGRHHGP
jgi:hypothetical protein